MPIYQTNSPEECQYVLENSDAVAVIVEDEAQLEKVRAVRDSLPKLKHVIRDGGDRRRRDLDERARAAGRGPRRVRQWEQRWSSVTSEDICTIIYTSGTTGPPKGCVISHGNYRSMLTMSLTEERARGGRDGLPLPPARALASRC